MTSRTVTLNDQQEYGVHDIGDVLSPRATDKAFSLLDIEDVLGPSPGPSPELEGTDVLYYNKPHITCFTY